MQTRRARLPVVFLLTMVMLPTSNAEDTETGRTDVTSETPDLRFYVVNDNVMGGRSDGDFEVSKGQLRFRGRTNTNGGGFSSIRSHPLRLDLGNYEGIRLRVRGDGRRYTLRLTTDARWQGREVAYWAEFDTSDGDWATVDVPFGDFTPKFRGFALDGPALDSGNVTGLGLMIYDGRDGRFELRVNSIAAYAARPPFSLADYRWERRLLVASAQTGDDQNLAALTDDVVRTASEFEDRDLVLILLPDDGVATSGERVLTPDEVGALRKSLGIRAGSFAVRLIGKDGSVKLASDAWSSIDEIYALIDTMPMRQRE